MKEHMWASEPAPAPRALPSPICCLPACLWVMRGTGLKVIHLIVAVWSLATGGEEEGEGINSLWKNSPASSLIFFLLIFPRPTKILAEDIFNNIFLI